MRTHQNGHSRQWWRRLERTAIAAHERDLLSGLQALAEQRVDCLVLPEPTVNPAGVLRLLPPQHQLLMAGVHPSQRRMLAAMQTAGPVQLTAGGRYGRLWWIALSNGRTHTVVAGCQFQLRGAAGGSGFIADTLRTPPREEKVLTQLELTALTGPA